MEGWRHATGATPKIEVDITDSETWDGKYTMYKLVIRRQSQSWFVHRRYSEFHRLNEQLKKLVAMASHKLPGKRMWGNLNPEFVHSRQLALQEFARGLVDDPTTRSLTVVAEFFQLNHRSSDSDENLSDDSAPSTGDEVFLGSSERCHARPSDFEFLRVIGKGSFGKVFLAHHRAEGSSYAIKVLQKRSIVQRNETKHIMSERNVLLKNLNHPFLVGLHYSFQTRDKLYFVLDYVCGGELFYYLQKERVFTEQRARFYAAEAGSALGYLHSQAIIYRDLKPENMLIDKQGHVVLTDFGLCKEGLIGCTQTSTFCGTPEYMAPEVLLKMPYDRAVDWWCLGAVLYEMLYGLPPFYSRDTHAMYRAILHGRPRLRPSASPDAQQLITALLHKQAPERLGSGPADFEQIKQHPFFAAIDWNALMERRLRPPYVPQTTSDDDVQHIDPAFTREPVSSSVGRSSMTRSGSTVSQQSIDRHFVGFSYDPGCDLHEGD